jgi:hypothetical protein
VDFRENVEGFQEGVWLELELRVKRSWGKVLPMFQKLKETSKSNPRTSHRTNMTSKNHPHQVGYC